MNRLRPAHSTLQQLPSPEPDAWIELHQVVKTFKNAAGEFTVLKGIDAAFRESQFVSVVGRSGSGKSTLLNMMTGIDHPTSGTVRVGEVYLHTLSEGQMSVWRGRSMGIVFQFFQLLPMLTLLENVMLPMDFCDMYNPAEREERALALLREVDLAGFEHKYPAAVSGGQQQSAAVARALANDPPILVADEPTGNLDTRTAEMILAIFEQQVSRGKTVIMVTHDNTLAGRAARKLVIADGEMLNEWLAKAFPDLPHHLLLALHHQAQTARYEPGQTIDSAGLLVVASGQVELLKSARTGPEVIDRLLPGRLYAPGMIETQNGNGKRRLPDLLKIGKKNDLTLRAAEPSQVLCISQEALAELTTTQPDLKAAFTRIGLAV